MLSDVCYTCLKSKKSGLIDLHDKDIDKTSYKQKLLTCLSKHRLVSDKRIDLFKLLSD